MDADDYEHQPMLTTLHGLGCCRLGPQCLCRTSARRDIGRPSIGSVHPMSSVNICGYTVLDADDCEHQPMLTTLHGLGCRRLGPQHLCRASARRDIGGPSIGSVHPMSGVNIWLCTASGETLGKSMSHCDVDNPRHCQCQVPCLKIFGYPEHI